jgi:hypothetical protein
MISFDTNVLVYATATRADDKVGRAQDLLRTHGPPPFSSTNSPRPASMGFNDRLARSVPFVNSGDAMIYFRRVRSYFVIFSFYWRSSHGPKLEEASSLVPNISSAFFA